MVIYLDSGDPVAMREYGVRVAGFTTNPTLLKQGGGGWADLLAAANGKPVSFEVFADDFDEMERQARVIASWRDNVYVKIPVTNTKGESTAPLMRKLGMEGIKINATAVMTMSQIETVARSLIYAPAILSIFCGRIADTGRDPVPFVTKALAVKHAETQILWASTREVYNVVQARQAGADIITMTPDLIKKLDLTGKDLTEYSLDTVKMFYNDAKGLSL